MLDMGLWHKQQVAPTTPTSPAPTSAAAAAAAAAAMRTSLPGAMPYQPSLLGPDQPLHFDLPTSPGSSANGGYGSHDGAAAGGWGAAAAGGGWGFWGSGGAASTAGGGWYGAAHSCGTAGSGSEHGNVRLRLYQVLPPSLAGRAPLWGNTLSLRGPWVCLDAPYFEAPGGWHGE